MNASSAALSSAGMLRDKLEVVRAAGFEGTGIFKQAACRHLGRSRGCQADFLQRMRLMRAVDDGHRLTGREGITSIAPRRWPSTIPGVQIAGARWPSWSKHSTPR